MQVKCSLCDQKETIHDDTLTAKRLVNRPLHTYMCKVCSDRIAVKTKERFATGKFKLFSSKKPTISW